MEHEIYIYSTTNDYGRIRVDKSNLTYTLNVTIAKRIRNERDKPNIDEKM